MEELAHSASAAVYASGSSAVRSLQVWRTVVSWAGFLFQLLLQILRGTLSWVQLLSFVPFLSSSSSSASSPTFRPLPVEPPAITPPPPPPTVSDGPSDKLTVVLDLDETLVCAYESSSLPSLVHNRAIEAGLKCFELECISAEKDAEGKQKVNHVTVFERPGLRDFLQQCSQFANLVLFTAGLEGYASPLVDRIDGDNKFTLRLYRSSTVSTEYREHVKDLSCVSKDLSRVIIVDNNPFSFLLQPRNGIPCIPFSAGQPCDQQLMGVLLPLLKHLSLQEDVRPILHEKFHMPEWFRQHGIPTVSCTL